jgi:hypothetical protein
MNSTSRAQFQEEYDDIWRCFYDGSCPTGKQRDRALAALAEQFPKEAALLRAEEDGWELYEDSFTKMFHETWYRRGGLETPIREETLVARYLDSLNLPFVMLRKSAV